MENDVPIENATFMDMMLNETQEPPGGGDGGGAPVTTTPTYINVTVSVFYGLIFVLGVVGK